MWIQGEAVYVDSSAKLKIHILIESGLGSQGSEAQWIVVVHNAYNIIIL